jgi:hypothetical protein
LLTRTATLREKHVEHHAGGARFAGIDELLRTLDQVLPHLDDDRVSDLLVKRVIADVETCVDALCGGFLAVALDAMRDVMEIELLLLDFSRTPDNRQRWLQATPTERWDRFRPRAIRRRLSSWGLVPKNDADYRGHSLALHPAPPIAPLMSRGQEALSREPFGVDSGYWELFEHARRILIAIDRYAQAQGMADIRAIVDLDRLTKVRSGWERTQEMQAIYLAMLQATRPTEPDSGGEPD